MRRSDTLLLFCQPKVQIIEAASMTMTFDCVSMIVRLLTSTFSLFLSVALFFSYSHITILLRKAGRYAASSCVSISWKFRSMLLTNKPSARA